MRVAAAGKDATSDYDRREAAGALGQALRRGRGIRAGAPTEAEMKKRKEAFEDAISATQAALAEGIVPGGGLALIRAIGAVKACEPAHQGDQLTGLHVLERAMEIPLRQIAQNAQLDAAGSHGEGRERHGRIRTRRSAGALRRLVQARHHRPGEGRAGRAGDAVSSAGTLLLWRCSRTKREPLPGQGLG